MRNSRAADEAEISRAGRSETLHIDRSALDQFVTEASRHPVIDRRLATGDWRLARLSPATFAMSLAVVTSEKQVKVALS